MAEVTPVASKVLAGKSEASGTLEKPAGIEEGDVLVAYCTHFKVGKVMALSGGWTKLKEVAGGSSNFRTAIFIKRVTAEEPASYSLSWEGGEAAWRLGVVSAYRGVRKTGEPYDVFSLAVGAEAKKSAAAPAVTTSVYNARLVWAEISQNGSAPSTPAGFTERAKQPLEALLADTVQAAPGSSGEVTGTLAESVYSAAGLVALPPEVKVTPTYREAVAATAGLVSLWQLDESSGTALDAKDSNPGTPNGTITRVEPSILPNGEGASAKLNGSTGYFSIADAVNLHTGDVGTLEAWIKLSALGSLRYVLDLGFGSLNMEVSTSNRVCLGRAGVLGELARSTVTLDERAHHVCVTKNGATRAVYIDGIDVTELVSNSTCESATTIKTIGRYHGSGLAFLAGHIQYPAVYSVALSAETVAKHYAAAFVSPPLTVPQRPYRGLVMR